MGTRDLFVIANLVNSWDMHTNACKIIIIMHTFVRLTMLANTTESMVQPKLSWNQI